LQSVLLQTFQDFEIIVVNDGSTDEGPEVVNTIIAQNSTSSVGRVRIINFQNAGVSVARNNGVGFANNEYIAFLDADDWWDEQFLSEMKSLIELCPEANLFGSNYFYVKAGRNRLEDKGLPSEFTAGYINYITTYSCRFVVPFNCSFVVVRKDAFLAEGGFKPNLKLGEDFDLWIRLALKYKVAYMNKPLAYSNQDVPKDQRALGMNKKWTVSEHYIFNLGYLNKEESQNPALKYLLDGLRVRSLILFRINGWYKKETSLLLEKIDFSMQQAFFKRVYTWPLYIIKTWFHIISCGSYVKRKMQLSKNYYGAD